MKKLLFALLVGLTSVAYSQVPQGINYQSVVRSTSGAILPSTAITVEFKLYNGLSTTLVYHETHSTTTNSFGMVNLIIGQGSPLSGSFNSIPWATTNGIGYEVLVNSNLVGSKQLFMSVPYALHAGSAPAPAVSFTNNILTVGGNTTTIPAGTTYTAGSGININTGVITSTANIIGAGSTSVTGTYPNLTISTPTTQVYTAGPGIDISTSGVISNTATAITPTITAGNNITINPTTPSNSYTVSAPTYSLTQTGNNIDLLQNGISIGTATLPVATSYSAGTGISISGNVISNTLTPVTPTLSVSGNSISINPGNTQTLPSYSLTQSGANIDLTQNGTSIATVTLTAATSTSLSAGSSNIILNQSGNAYTITPVTPTFTNSGPTTITGFYPNFTVNSVASPTYTAGSGISISSGTIINTSPGITPTITGTGNAFVVTSGNSYTVNVPTQTLTVTGNSVITSNLGGSATISPASLTYTSASNTLKLTDGLSSNTYTLNNYSAGTGIAISGSAPNFVITNTAVISSPTITGTGIASVTTVGNTYTVNVPAPTYTPANGVLGFGTNTLAIGLWAAPTATSVVTTNSTSLVGIGTNTPTYKLDVYGTASVPATIHGYNSGATASSTGVFGENPNNGIGVYGQSNTGAGVWGKSTSGAGIYGESTSGDGGKFILSSNTTTANAVNAQTNGTGVALYAKSYNATPLAAKFDGSTEILHTATTANPTIHLKEITTGLNRIKFSNPSVSGVNFWEIGAQTSLTPANSAISINHNEGAGYKSEFLVYGDGKVQVHNLNTALGSFHVMESSATANGGIISEGFAQPGQIIIARNNQPGLASRLGVIAADEIGRLVFGGCNSAGNYTGNSSKISVRATEAFSSTSQGSEMLFSTVKLGTISTLDVMKLADNGDVIINPNGTNNNSLLNVKAKIRVDSSLTMAGYNTPPAQSPVTEGRIYYDKTAQKFKVSENGGAYVDLIPGSGTSPWSQSGLNIFTTNSTDKVGIGTNTPSSKLQVENILAGDRALYLYQAPSTTNEALFIDNRGTQQAAIIENNNSANTNVALLATSNGIGGAIRAQNTSTANTTDVLNVSQVGQGNASYFSVNNGGNFAKAIEAQHNGNGSAIGAANSGSGRAGEFAIQNATNNSSALYATTNGGGNAIYADNSNATNTSAVIQAVSNSSGVAYYGTNTNGSTAQFDGFGSSTTFNAINYNSGNAINASANSGSAINAVNSSSVSPAMIVSNTGINDAARFTSTQGKAIYAQNNSTGGNSVVELASNGNGTALQVYKNAGASGSVASFANFATSNGSDAVVISNAGAANSLYTAKPSGSTAGSVAKFDNLGTANGADAVMVTNNGAGAAIHAVSGPTVTGSTNVALWVESGHLKATGATPAVTSTVALLSSYSVIGNDVAGKISVTTVATSVGANQEMVKITFNKSYPSGVTPNIIITPSNANAAGIQAYVSTVSNTGFSLFFNVATAALIRTYTFNYMIIE